MNEFNSKYFKTALRMDEALIALLEKKDLDYITVKEICEEADVNRSTFYLHYETVGDLVDETTEMINKTFPVVFSSERKRHFGRAERPAAGRSHPGNGGIPYTVSPVHTGQ